MKLQDKDILFEDNHLLCVYKPSGICTQPADDNTSSLEQLAKMYIKEKYNKPGNVFLHAVHRLDKETSGIVIFAKTQKALSRMHKALRQNEVKKTYRACVEGVLTPTQATLEHYLAHGDHKAIVTTKEKGKKCRLHYRVLKQSNGTSEVLIELETGRYHQIRVQFAATGHPIVGDIRYGAKKAKTFYLCHEQVSFMHPVKKDLVINISCRKYPAVLDLG